jgi:hypothetical protein
VAGTAPQTDLGWDLPVGEWTRGPRTLRGQVGDVAIAGESRWWGRQWLLSTGAPQAAGLDLVLFVSRRGMAHGYWRDVPVGEAGFDRDHFVFTDQPALLPLVLGAVSRAALSAGSIDDAVELHAAGDRVGTRGLIRVGDAGAVQRHLDVQHALRADRQALVGRWHAALAAGSARPLGDWPLSGIMTTRGASVSLDVRWRRPGSRDALEWQEAAASLRTVLTGPALGGAPWRLTEVGLGLPWQHQLGPRRFAATGPLPPRWPLLAPALAGADVVALGNDGSALTLELRGLASGRQLDDARRLIELLTEAAAPTSPYR